MTERVSDNVVYIDEYLKERETPRVTAIKKRIAQIGIEQLLLGSEKNRLLSELQKANEEPTL